MKLLLLALFFLLGLAVFALLLWKGESWIETLYSWIEARVGKERMDRFFQDDKDD